MSNSVDRQQSESETLRFARDLIRIDTTNFGGGNARGEQEAAEYIEAHLNTLGIHSQLIESAPRRTNVIARVPGRDTSLSPLVLHGHLDVVPAIESEWSVDPFAAEIREGMLWGRGAVDMKNMNAMILSAVSELLRTGEGPRRELILAFFADEEDGGALGSGYMVTEHPDLFGGAKTAVSEVGGYSIHVGGKRAYLIQTGEKAMMWLRIRARGKGSHGSQRLGDNAIITLAKALVRLDEHEWHLRLTDTTTRLLTEIASAIGAEPDLEYPDRLVVHTGLTSGFISSSLRTTTNVTMVDAGYKQNVVPDSAEARIDVRTVPGDEENVFRDVERLLGPEIDIDILHQDVGLELPFSGDLVNAMVAALRGFDPDASVFPYLMPAGTDNKALSKIGIDGYGFVPMQLPADYDFVSMFHGVDERIPLEALAFGHDVLTELLRNY